VTDDRQEDDLLVQLMLGEPTIAALTETAVAGALRGFELTAKREMSWIARAVQGAIFVSMRPADESPTRRSNAEIRNEILRLADECSKLWLNLCQRSTEVDAAIWDRAFRDWVAEAPDDLVVPDIGQPLNSKRFEDALFHVEWLSTYLRRAAHLERQTPNWRRGEEREQRILRAQCLSPIFEQAFGAQPTVNTWPMARSLGPWADFYQRIVALAFGERATPNLEGVLDEARRRDKAFRVSFEPGVIPN